MLNSIITKWFAKYALISMGIENKIYKSFLKYIEAYAGWGFELQKNKFKNKKDII